MEADSVTECFLCKKDVVDDSVNVTRGKYSSHSKICNLRSAKHRGYRKDFATRKNIFYLQFTGKSATHII